VIEIYSSPTIKNPFMRNTMENILKNKLKEDEMFWEILETQKPKTKKDKQFYYNLFYRFLDEESRNKLTDILKDFSLPIWFGVYLTYSVLGDVSNTNKQ
jgi:hypothetical protein